MYSFSAMKCLEGNGQRALSLLCQEPSVRRLVKRADSIRQVTHESRVQVWRVDQGRMSSAIKWSSPCRSLDAADQISAEQRAAQLLSAASLCCPLLVLPVKTILDPELGAISIAPYAGDAVHQLRVSGVWQHCGTGELLRLCKRLAICLLLTQVLYLDQDGKQRFIHKDIKLSNVCYKASTDLFLLVDYGAFSSLDQEHWVDCVDLRYITPEMAFYNSDEGRHAAESEEGRRYTTHHSVDRYQTALAVAEFFLGRLPAPIDFIRYNGDVADYCEAVRNFSWAEWLDTSPEARDMPPEMREWLAGMLDRCPDQRPESAWGALQHAFLQDEYQDVLDCVEMAQPGWQQCVAEIRQCLKGSSIDGSSRGGGSSGGFVSSFMSSGFENAQLHSSNSTEQIGADAFAVTTYSSSDGSSDDAAAASSDYDCSYLLISSTSSILSSSESLISDYIAEPATPVSLVSADNHSNSNPHSSYNPDSIACEDAAVELDAEPNHSSCCVSSSDSSGNPVAAAAAAAEGFSVGTAITAMNPADYALLHEYGLIAELPPTNMPVQQHERDPVLQYTSTVAAAAAGYVQQPRSVFSRSIMHNSSSSSGNRLHSGCTVDAAASLQHCMTELEYQQPEPMQHQTTQLPQDEDYPDDDFTTTYHEVHVEVVLLSPHDESSGQKITSSSAKSHGKKMQQVQVQEVDALQSQSHDDDLVISQVESAADNSSSSSSDTAGVHDKAVVQERYSSSAWGLVWSIAADMFSTLQHSMCD